MVSVTGAVSLAFPLSTATQLSPRQNQTEPAIYADTKKNSGYLRAQPKLGVLEFRIKFAKLGLHCLDGEMF